MAHNRKDDRQLHVTFYRQRAGVEQSTRVWNICQEQLLSKYIITAKFSRIFTVIKGKIFLLACTVLCCATLQVTAFVLQTAISAVSKQVCFKKRDGAEEEQQGGGGDGQADQDSHRLHRQV